jgi:hypothetical protein
VVEVPDLPLNVTLSQAYSDFIGYMYNATKTFFIESRPNGQNVWDRLQEKVVFVFCTPNVWSVSHQTFLRDATIKAGLVTKKDADERVEFISEAEASVHYTMRYTECNTWLKEDSMFAIIDAGGSTVDSTLYECTNQQPLRLEEVCASECIQVCIPFQVNIKYRALAYPQSLQTGGVFVDRAVRRLLADKLAGSTFGDDDYLNQMMLGFERKVRMTSSFA